MAQEGRAPFRSSWAFNDVGTRDLIGLCTAQPREGRNVSNVWKTWFLDGITITTTAKTIEDTLETQAGGGGGFVIL